MTNIVIMQLPAMRQLKKHYESNKKEDFLEQCPLCTNRNESALKNELIRCQDCVWKIEEGFHCTEFLGNLNLKHPDGELQLKSMSEARRKKSSKWNKIRIEQLTKWIAKYEKE